MSENYVSVSVSMFLCVPLNEGPLCLNVSMFHVSMSDLIRVTFIRVTS